MIAFALAAALAAAPAADRNSCVFVGPVDDAQYTGVDDHTIVIRSRGRAWRATTTRSSLITDPFAVFVNVVRGPSQLCTPLDFQLSVAVPPGAIRTPLIVQDFRPIPPAEAEALTRRAPRR